MNASGSVLLTVAVGRPVDESCRRRSFVRRCPRGWCSVVELAPGHPGLLFMQEEGAGTKGKNAWWSNIRRALQTGFDRQVNVNTLLGGIEEAAYGLVAPGVDGPNGQTFREVVGKTVPELSAASAGEL